MGHGAVRPSWRRNAQTLLEGSRPKACILAGIRRYVLGLDGRLHNPLRSAGCLEEKVRTVSNEFGKPFKREDRSHGAAEVRQYKDHEDA